MLAMLPLFSSIFMLSICSTFVLYIFIYRIFSSHLLVFLVFQGIFALYRWYRFISPLDSPSAQIGGWLKMRWLRGCVFDYCYCYSMLYAYKCSFFIFYLYTHRTHTHTQVETKKNVAFWCFWLLSMLYLSFCVRILLCKLSISFTIWCILILLGDASGAIQKTVAKFSCYRIFSAMGGARVSIWKGILMEWNKKKKVLVCLINNANIWLLNIDIYIFRVVLRIYPTPTNIFIILYV